ncbi:MAG: hypothetical protein ABGW50_01650 [Thermococcus sp.]
MPVASLFSDKFNMPAFRVSVINNTGQTLTDVAIPVEISTTSPLIQFLQNNSLDPRGLVAYSPEDGKFLPTWFVGPAASDVAFSKYVVFVRGDIGSAKDLIFVYHPLLAEVLNSPMKVLRPPREGYISCPDCSTYPNHAYDVFDSNDYIDLPCSLYFTNTLATFSDMEGGVVDVVACNYMLAVDYVKLGSTSCAHAPGFIKGYSWDGSFRTSFLPPWVAAHVRYNDGTVYAISGQPGSVTPYALGNYDTVNWNKTLVVMDFINQVYDVYVNDALSQTDIPFLLFDTVSVGDQIQMVVTNCGCCPRHDSAAVACYSVKPNFTTIEDSDISYAAIIMEEGYRPTLDLL